jgi:microcystin-dependent protein
MTTTTSNYTWQMPDPGASANTWGTTLNATTQAIDAQVFLNQQGLVPVGAVTMFGGASPPANWLICDGSSLPTSKPYDQLFAVIGYIYGGAGGTFALPNLQGVFPLGVGPGNALASKGGAASVTLDYTMIPGHTHPVTVTDPKHTHTQTQTPHAHSDAGHGHAVIEPPGGHTHPGVIQPGGQFSLGIAGGTLIGGAGATTGAATGISIQTGAANIQPQVANLSAISTDATGITATVAANAGGGQPHNNMPPYLALNMIIRYQ